MECNKDEAERAKLIAEERFGKKDYKSARKFARKAQALYPDLKDISQMIATFDIYIASDKVGEVDHYAMLSVNPSADEETIKKQYKKMALVHHPDKNKSVGAEGAFKIVLGSYSILADMKKRSAYDQRRAEALSHLQQNVPLHAKTAPSGGHHHGNRTESQPNGTPNTDSKTTSVPKAQRNSAKKPKKRKPTEKPNTFWTMCEYCEFHYEFVRLYFNGRLLCDNCKKPFLAKETAPPPGFSPSKVPCQQNNHGQDAKESGIGDLEKKAPVAKKPRQGPRPDPVEKGKNVASAEDAKESGPDDLEKKAPAAKKPRQLPRSNLPEKGKNVASAERSGMGPNQNAQDPGKNAQAAYKPGSVQEKVPHSGTSNVNGRGHCSDAKAARVVDGVLKDLKRSRHSETSNVDGRGHRTDAKAARVADRVADVVLKDLKRAREGNARVGSQEPLKQQKLDASSRKKTNSMANTNGGVGTGSASHTRDNSPFDRRKVMLAKAQQDIRNKLNVWKSEEREFGISTGKNDKNGKSDLSTNASVDKRSTTTTMFVPDPDFHDFDNDRTARSFGDNEVWSAYDNKDGMPRLYALIHKVDSTKPFKLTISWLNSKTNAEFSSMDWVRSGFDKTCGEYWVGKYVAVRSIESFSQKVNFSKTKRGSVLIFPQKDEVWALYKNWSSEWDRHTPKDVVQKYDMVKVLDDYNEENGISVAPLVKVVGFKTVFHPELDPCVIKRVPKEEMLRFSHRVPHHVLTGQESENAPKGFLELDPASTPKELLQVITEANKAVSPS